MSDGETAMRSRYDRRWLSFLLFTPLLLWGCWSAPFSELDDQLFIASNPALKPDAPWSAVFDRDIDPLYMPLTYLSIRIDRVAIAPLFATAAGVNAWPAAIRTINLLLHIGVAMLVWWLMRGLNVGPGVAAFVTAAFALHPTACHAVCWAIERKTMLAGLFGFAAIGIYMRGNSARHNIAAAALHGLALLSKPSAFGLLPVVVVWEVLGRPTFADVDSPAATYAYSSPRELAWKLTPWVATAALALWNQLHVLSPVALGPIGGSLFTVALTDVPVLQRYIVNFICPFWLAAEYGLPAIVSIFDARLWLAAAFLAAFVGSTFYCAGTGRWRMVLFAWLWFLGALGPALNFVGKNNLMEDCHAYLSAPAFWLVVGLALKGIAARFPAVMQPRLAFVSLAILSAALAFGSESRSYLFQSTEILFSDTVRTEPKGALAHLILAQLLRRRGDSEYASGDLMAEKVTRSRELAELEAGIAGYNFERTRLATNAHIWLARAYYEHNRAADAATQLDLARHSPQGIDREQGATVLRFLGLLAGNRGELEQAVKYFDAALSLSPSQTFLWIDRARALVALRDTRRKSGDALGVEACELALKQAFENVAPADPVFAELQRSSQPHD